MPKKSDDVHVDSMDALETRRFKAWEEKHYKKCGPRGGFRRIYTPTGIGVSVQIQCPKCGKVEDVTDYGAW